MTAKDNSFGKTVKAYRLGFRQYPSKDCWLRIGKVKEDVFELILVPIGDTIPNSKYKEYYCWWEGSEGLNCLDLVPKLKSVNKINKPLILLVNYVGEIL